MKPFLHSLLIHNTFSRDSLSQTQLIAYPLFIFFFDCCFLCFFFIFSFWANKLKGHANMSLRESIHTIVSQHLNDNNSRRTGVNQEITGKINSLVQCFFFWKRLHPNKFVAAETENMTARPKIRWHSSASTYPDAYTLTLDVTIWCTWPNLINLPCSHGLLRAILLIFWATGLAITLITLDKQAVRWALEIN